MSTKRKNRPSVDELGFPTLAGNTTRGIKRLGSRPKNHVAHFLKILAGKLMKNIFQHFEIRTPAARKPV